MGNFRILIIEDMILDKTVLLNTLVQKCNINEWDIDFAVDGKEGVELLQQNKRNYLRS